MTTTVRVRTPCRLHFGMFSFGHADRAQFGGVGAMIEPPSVEVEISPAESFDVQGPLADRVRQTVELLVVRWNLSQRPACRLTVRSPRDHTGLGVGTQLNLATAAGLRRYLGLSELSVEELSAAVSRGGRSAVGTYGFQLGGLIVDAGKVPGRKLGKLETRVAIPEAWRFVLICDPALTGLAGSSEISAFDRLPAVPGEITNQLSRFVHEEMLPALHDSDCCRFGDAVYRFGRMAGDCFSAVQGGPFAKQEIERLVESIRAFGVAGVGQSSWGPTVYTVAACDEDAQRIVEWVRDQKSAFNYQITVARPNNTGATIETIE